MFYYNLVTNLLANFFFVYNTGSKVMVPLTVSYTRGALLILLTVSIYLYHHKNTTLLKNSIIYLSDCIKF